MYVSVGSHDEVNDELRLERARTLSRMVRLLDNGEFLVDESSSESFAAFLNLVQKSIASET